MTHDFAPRRSDLTFAIDTARAAGDLVMNHRRRGFDVERKSDVPDDFVTIADREASELIIERIRRHAPFDGVLSEEMADDETRLAKRRVWIVDPIDGTKEFVHGSPDFAVSIGLTVDGEPRLGVVYAPATGDVYAGLDGVEKNGRTVGFSKRPVEDAVIAVSATEYERELTGTPLRGMRPSGSIALKLAKIAAGEADATFTINPRSEWDVCAGHALVAAAGGSYTFRDGAAIGYNAPDPALRRGTIGGRGDVVAWLARELDRLAVAQQHLFVREGEAAFALLPPELRGHPSVHVRTAGRALESAVALERRGEAYRVAYADGPARGVSFIMRNLRRSLSIPDAPNFSESTTSDATE
ncbi:3'(2'),5'-bisphosphate nucleotidase CysQ [Deinococcus yavapaiensis]|uniref:3'(2'),5'-bisphosphate nucleotidase n=1 Tax=Deinococcus yavapaiensis KR-236 TaxID=694435 RepID=A0A318S650_9DEIO|nr:3'(2'),5'-bisphosphate nucleotidase CysQ [Deinococcus yavapaiensis]PYE53102.1 3'(2'),5'-bisphosphate nucleotidase [Deinococcus yavapaiensis KR-236]